MASLLALAGSEVISSVLWQASQNPPAWGVFDSNNNQVLFPDSVLEFDYQRAYNVPDFPVQQGGFASYNKVITPFQIRMRLSKSGQSTDRSLFLLSLENLCASIALYSVVTPDAAYDNCNATHYEVSRRGARGAVWLNEVDLYFTQIIQVAPQYQNTGTVLPNAQSAAAQPVTNQGNVQPLPSSSSQSAAGQNAIGSVVNSSFF